MDAKFTRVTATEQERFEYWLRVYRGDEERAADRTRRRSRTWSYRYLCKCGKRIWGSGFGVGSHNTACPIR